MGLIERIKSALGLETSASSPSQPGRTTAERPTRTEDTDTGGEPTAVTDEEPDSTAGDVEPSASADDEVDVTVEHEPTFESEDAVEPSTETEDAVKGTDTAEQDEPDTDTEEIEADLEDIKGIGPTYAERLREVGIEDVAALADADASDLSERTDIAESRVQNWIDRAGTY